MKVNFQVEIFLISRVKVPCLDLITSPSPSMKIQIVCGKITDNLGFKSPLRKVKNFLSFFLFIFKIFTQGWVSLILTIFWHLVLLSRNQIKHVDVEKDYLYQYLICKTRYSKMARNKDMQFFIENLKMNRTRTKIILTYRIGDSNPRFSRPWFWFSWKVRVTRSNQNKLLEEIGLYLGT